MGKNHYKSRGIQLTGDRWVVLDTVILRYVLENYPELYMEEMRDQVCILTGKSWSISYLYRQARRLGFSLQKLFNRAMEIDQNEQVRYHTKLSIYLLQHAEMMIYLEETVKSRALVEDNECERKREYLLLSNRFLVHIMSGTW